MTFEEIVATVAPLLRGAVLQYAGVVTSLQVDSATELPRSALQVSDQPADGSEVSAEEVALRAVDAVRAHIDANGATPKIVRRAAQFLIAYTRYHFDSEEYSMVATCYDEIAPHNREHKMMRRQLARLAAVINADGDDVDGNVRGLQRLILGWIQNHISHTDMAFARYCSSQPEELTGLYGRHFPG